MPELERFAFCVACFLWHEKHAPCPPRIRPSDLPCWKVDGWIYFSGEFTPDQMEGNVKVLDKQGFHWHLDTVGPKTYRIIYEPKFEFP